MPASDETLLRKALEIVEEFRLGVNEQLPSQTISVLLTIALDDGNITVTDIEKRLSMALSSASRNVSVLSDRPRRGRRATEPGYGLIEYRQDPQDFRRERLHLTRKGARLINRVVDVLRNGG